MQLWSGSLESSTFNPFFPESSNANANSQCSARSTLQMHSYGLVSCAVLCSYQSHTMKEQEHTTTEPMPSYSTRGRGSTSKGRLLFPSLGLINNPKETHWVTSSTYNGKITEIHLNTILGNSPSFCKRSTDQTNLNTTSY